MSPYREADSGGGGHDPRPWGIWEEWEQWLYIHRAKVMTVIGATILINLEYFVISNLAAGLKAGPAVESAQVAAELGLALGTVGLAIAAFVQARAASDQSNVSSAQLKLIQAQVDVAEAQTAVLREQFRAGSAPHLRIDVRGASARVEAGRRRTEVLSPGDWLSTDQFTRAFQLVNAGPGVAENISIRVTGFNSDANVALRVTDWGPLGVASLGPDQTTQLLLQSGYPSSEHGPDASRGDVAFVVVEVRCQGPGGQPAATDQSLPAGCAAIAGLALRADYDEYGQPLGEYWLVLGDADARATLAEHTAT